MPDDLPDVLSALTPSLASRLRQRLLRRTGQFDCGVRVTEGQIDGESRYWRHRRSRIEDGLLLHGRKTVLAVRLGKQVHRSGLNLSPDAVVFEAEEVKTGARIEVACMPHARGQLERLGNPS